jgi:glycosyltransferase involved in cell wall biosynthesis
VRPAATPHQEGSVVSPGGPRVVWIGRFSREKRLELLLDVAGQCPEIEFEVVGDGIDEPYVRGLKLRASVISNVRMRGYLPHDQTLRCYDRANALVCTSSTEGFPNVFLEAWSRGIPVVTTFDPDGVVEDFNVGLYVGTTKAMAGAIGRICYDKRLSRRLGGRAHEYYRAHHTVEAAVSAYDRLFQQLIREKGQDRKQQEPCRESVHASE